MFDWHDWPLCPLGFLCVRICSLSIEVIFIVMFIVIYCLAVVGISLHCIHTTIKLWQVCLGSKRLWCDISPCCQGEHHTLSVSGDVCRIHGVASMCFLPEKVSQTLCRGLVHPLNQSWPWLPRMLGYWRVFQGQTDNKYAFVTLLIGVVIY